MNYGVKVEGTNETAHRHIDQLRSRKLKDGEKSKEGEIDVDIDIEIASEEEANPIGIEATSSESVLRRSNRVTKTPVNLRDYVSK